MKNKMKLHRIMKQYLMNRKMCNWGFLRKQRETGVKGIFENILNG